MPEGDDVTLRFIPTAAGETPQDYANFGRYAVQEMRSGNSPVEVTGLMPFQANVRAPSAALLETPRMFQPGYVAKIDGRSAEVLSSPRGLAMLPIPSGEHKVEVSFRGPLPLRLAYWTTLLAWIGLLATAATVALRRVKN